MKIKKINSFLAYAIFLALLLMLFGSSLSWYETITFSSLVFYLIYFVLEFDNRIMILEFSGLLAIIQYIVAPVLYYYQGSEHFIFETIKMRQDPDTYFKFAIPGTLLYSFGLLLLNRTIKIDYDQIVAKLFTFIDKNPNIPLRLLVIGLLGSLSMKFAPTSIRLFLLFIENFTFMSILLYYFKFKKTNSKKYLYICVIFLIVQFALSIKNAIFGELIFLFICCFLLIAPTLILSLRTKVVLMFTGLVLIVGLQIIKPIIRASTWGQDKGWAQVIEDLRNPEYISKDVLFSDLTKVAFIARLNQGALISNLMNNTPSNEPFAKGATITNALVGSFVPRLFWPDKPQSGQRLYEQFVGIELQESVSMGISPLGEMYANFGDVGKYAMLPFAALFVFFLNTLLKNAQRSPHLFYWIPVVFYHAIKVETDLTRSIGFLIKALLIMLVIKVLFRHAIGLKL